MNPDSTLDALMGQLVALQRRVDNLVKPEVPRWQDWTPTVTQSGSVTYNAGILYAEYIVDITGLVTLTAFITITGTGSAGSAIIVGGIPSTIQIATVELMSIGSVIIAANSTRYEGSVRPVTSTTIGFQADSNTAGIGGTPSFALANGNTIGFTAKYRRA